MKTETQSSTAGYWMVVALVALLSAPLAIGHYTLKTPPAVTHHAEAAIN